MYKPRITYVESILAPRKKIFQEKESYDFCIIYYIILYEKLFWTCIKKVLISYVYSNWMIIQ